MLVTCQVTNNLRYSAYCLINRYSVVSKKLGFEIDRLYSTGIYKEKISLSIDGDCTEKS